MTKPPRTPRWILIAATLAVPVLLLACLELALRVTGTGRLEPLFVPVPQVEGYLQPNSAVVGRFFPDPAHAPAVEIDTTYFRMPKPAEAFRIIVMGESSAAGFPYGRWSSPGEFLHQRLQRGSSDREIEVISVAMAAVTSYVLLDFVEEVLAVEPDAIVIYTGHNEYLGIGGVGSSFLSATSPWLARATSTLRRWHLYRSLERLIARFRAPPATAQQNGTLMARVAKERQIALGSPLYDRGIEQFRGNLQRMLHRFSAAGVPVFIGTLASNERDQPPFESVLAPSTNAAQWQRMVAAAQEALAGGDAQRAESHARAALAVDDTGASAHYALGRALDTQGRYAEARAAYLAAKDRDALRFRAPESLNDVIRGLTRRSGTTLIDVQRELASRAQHGIIGDDLMLEHLHPNVRGYFQLAQTYYEPLLELAAARPVDSGLAWRERPATEIDVLGGNYRVAFLKSDWPFVSERRAFELPPPQSDLERIAQRWFAGSLPWAEATNEALVLYQQQGNAPEAARVAVNLAEAFLQLAQPQAVAGRLLIRSEAPERAVHYLGRALRLAPDDLDTGLSLAEAQFRSGDRAASAATLQTLMQRAPDDPRPRQWLSVVQSAP